MRVSPIRFSILSIVSAFPGQAEMYVVSVARPAKKGGGNRAFAPRPPGLVRRSLHISSPQIKWITDIEVTDLESDNHYHYFDNRVLPSQVSVGHSRAAPTEAWPVSNKQSAFMRLSWYRPRPCT